LVKRVEIAELAERLEKLSARYGERLGFERDGDWFLLKLQEEVGELTQAYLQHTGRARTKGLSSAEIRQAFHREFADVLCQLLLLARHYDVDLTGQIEKKWLCYEVVPPGAGGRS
jgi:NTP pyrophosphatase (non-canonical NTP hydrolase)